MFLFGKRKKNQKENKQAVIEDQQAPISESDTANDDEQAVALVNPTLIQSLAGDASDTQAPVVEAKSSTSDKQADKANEQSVNTATDHSLSDPVMPQDVALDQQADTTSTVEESPTPQAAAVESTETIQAAEAASTENESTKQSETTDDAFIVDANQLSEQKKPAKKGLFSRLRQGLSKTGSALTEGMGALVLGQKKVDDDLLEDLETRLLMADVGIEATQEIMDDLTNRVSRKQLSDVDSLMKALEDKMSDMLQPAAKPLTINAEQKPTVILMVGINGAGKTTTIGKLAKKYQAAGKSVMLAAGDTFRAAAVEQLQTWGERNNVPVIAQKTGSDTASVIYDAVQSAQARHIDILLADTAGRLHTQDNLMDELKKVKRVMQKLDKTAPHEIMLIVDASIGQNALVQAREFNQALGLTGITITKLDGTAKGGILFAIAQQLDVAIRYVGVGEGIDDLQVFDAKKFTQALLATDKAE